MRKDRLKIGELKHKIDIQQKSNTKDSEAVVNDSWPNFYSGVWSAIEPNDGREYFSSQAFNSEITTLIKIRFLPGITSSMRIAKGTKIYDIQYVIDYKEQHRELHLMCKEVI